MSLKKHFACLAVISSVGLCALANTAMASDGTITFTGEITDVTCTVTGGGAASGSGNGITVTLNKANSSALSSVGSTAGDTAFSLILGGTNCTNGKTAALSVESAQTAQLDTTTGALKNTGTATGVEVRLFNKASNSAINLGLGGTLTNGNSLITENHQPAATIANNTATLNYYAQYLATGTITAGTVSTSLVYSMIYN